jgi:hypothetical protein
MISNLYRTMGWHIAAFSLVTPPVMARTAPGPAAGAEVTRSFMPQDAAPQETAVLHRRYTGSLLAPLPVGIFSGMIVITGQAIRNERLYQTAEKSTLNPNIPNIYAPAPADQPLTGFGMLYIPHHQEGAPLYSVQIQRWNRFSQPEFVPPLWEITLGSTIDSKDLPLTMSLSPRDQTEVSANILYQRFGNAQRFVPSIGYRTLRPSGWELDLLLPYRGMIAWQNRSNSFRVYTGAKLDPRQDAFFKEETQDIPKTSGWALGWAHTLLVGTRVEVAPPLYAALELGVQRESYKGYTEQNRQLKSLETMWGPWARISLESWIKTP